MHEDIDRIGARDVDHGRRTRHRKLQTAEFLRIKLERHAHISAEHDNVAPDASELLGEPLAPRLAAKEEHARGRTVRLHNGPERFGT